jgi:hypothetical protein
MVYFQTKNRNLGKFWRALQWKIFVYFIDIWSILQPLDIFYGHLVYFVVILYNFPCVGILYQEKSGSSVHFFVHGTILVGAKQLWVPRKRGKTGKTIYFGPRKCLDFLCTPCTCGLRGIPDIFQQNSKNSSKFFPHKDISESRTLTQTYVRSQS